MQKYICAGPFRNEFDDSVAFEMENFEAKMLAVKGRDLFKLLCVNDDASKLHRQVTLYVEITIPQQSGFSNDGLVRRAAPVSACRGGAAFWGV